MRFDPCIMDQPVVIQALRQICDAPVHLIIANKCKQAENNSSQTILASWMSEKQLNLIFELPGP